MLLFLCHFFLSNFYNIRKKHSFELGEYGSNSGDKQQCLRVLVTVVTAMTVMERRSGLIWSVIVKALYNTFASGLDLDYYGRQG